MKWNLQPFIFHCQMRSRLGFISVFLTLGWEDVHSCHTPWFHLMAVKPQPSALRDTAQSKHRNLLSCDGQNTELQIFCEPEAKASHFKRLACLSCLCLPSHRPQRICSQSFLLEFNCSGLIFVKFSENIFSPFVCDLASLQVLVSYSYAVVTNVDEYLFMWWELWLFLRKNMPRQKSTAWPWKCSNNTHSSLHPTMHSGFPSFISRLVTTAENWAVPNQTFPCLPMILCCYQGSQVCSCPSPRLETWDYFRTGGSHFRKIFLQCWLLRSGIWEISL